MGSHDSMDESVPAANRHFSAASLDTELLQVEFQQHVPQPVTVSCQKPLSAMTSSVP